jgi:hypothetical protein
VGRLWLLPRDFENVAERVAVKAAHGCQVGTEGLTVPLLKLLDEVLHVSGDDFFRRLPFWLLLISSFELHFFAPVCPVGRFCFSPAQRDKND